MVTVVGLIREVDITSTKITYTLDDTSGTIRAIKWLDSEAVSVCVCMYVCMYV